MAKYGKITDYKKAYVTLLRQEGTLSLRQLPYVTSLSLVSSSSLDWVWSVNCLKNGVVDLRYSTEERRIAF